jgi:hypothetical protein
MTDTSQMDMTKHLTEDIASDQQRAKSVAMISLVVATILLLMVIIVGSIVVSDLSNKVQDGVRQRDGIRKELSRSNELNRLLREQLIGLGVVPRVPSDGSEGTPPPSARGSRTTVIVSPPSSPTTASTSPDRRREPRGPDENGGDDDGGGENDDCTVVPTILPETVVVPTVPC